MHTWLLFDRVLREVPCSGVIGITDVGRGW